MNPTLESNMLRISKTHMGKLVRVCWVAACWNTAAALIITWLFYKAETQKNYTSIPALPGCQNMIFWVPPASFFRPKMHQNRWRPGFRPRPRWGSSRRSTRSSTAGEEASPLPRLLHPRRLRGASILAPLAPRFSRLTSAPRSKIVATPLMGGDEERQFLSLPMAEKTT